jgi:hypothetical protein
VRRRRDEMEGEETREREEKRTTEERRNKGLKKT